MSKLSPPAQLDLIGNVAEQWKRWKLAFDIYMRATKSIAEDDATKVAILLHVAGGCAVELYETFEFEKPEDKLNYEVVVNKFESYCIPRKNYVFERFRFTDRTWKEGETVDQFVTALRAIAADTDFTAEERDKNLRDKIVFHVKDIRIQERLLRNDNLTLDSALTACRAAEVTHQQMQVLAGTYRESSDVVMHKVSKVQGESENRRYQQECSKIFMDCYKCGGEHKPWQCPAYGRTCHKCRKKGHFAKMCKSEKIINTLKTEDHQTEELFMGIIVSTKNSEGWEENIWINGTQVTMRLDTGAQANVLDEQTYRRLKRVPGLIPTKVRLKSYSNHYLRPIGEISVQCEAKGKVAHLKMLVVKNRVQPVLGLEGCQQLNLVKRVDSIVNESTRRKEELLHEYEDVFSQGVGRIQEQFHITLEDKAQPVVHPPRKFPFSVLPKLKKELEKMENMGVIEKVIEPTDWVNSMLVREKKDGSLRVCLDPKDLNKAMKRVHHVLPTVEEVLSKMKGKKVFTVFDVQYGFWNMPLDQASSKLTTFNTPWGRYCFKVLPYGIKAAPEYFQRKNEELFGDIPNLSITFDDMILATENVEENYRLAKEVLRRAREQNIKLNPHKLQWEQSEVSYLGHIISGTGLKMDPTKVKAVEEMPSPTNKKEAQRLLGMLNYLAPFVPNLAAITTPIRDMMKKDSRWMWMHEHEEAMNKIKNILSSEPVLRYFDPSKPITLQVDASQYGLGMALMQEGRPVAYSSRLLSETERRYSQIEKEMLAVAEGLRKFHRYVYGQRVDIQTDHKPLLGIVNKELHKVSPRLQRMLLKISEYTYQLNYIPGSQMFIADTLSRAPIPAELDDHNIAEECERVVHQLVEQFPMTHQKYKVFVRETEKDATLQKVIQLIQTEWKWSDNKGDPEVSRYWHVRDMLHTGDGLLMLDNRIVVPKTLKKEMLDRIHEGHIGRDRMIEKAKQVLYWPGMNKDIAEQVSKCSVCAQYRNMQQKEPLTPYPVPSRPWSHLGADIAEYKGDAYLVVVDYFSKYPEVVSLPAKTGTAVIKALKSIMARHGIPDILTADNMPFGCKEMRDFARDWEFNIITSSPLYPQSNGASERCIQTIKNLFKKAEATGHDPHLALLEHRNTPVAGMKWSPAQLLMNRRLKTRLPTTDAVLQPEACRGVQEVLRGMKQRMKTEYDRNAKPLPPLRQHDGVRMRVGKQWIPVKLEGSAKEPNSWVVKTPSGNQIRRNRRQLMQTHKDASPYMESERVEWEEESSQQEENDKGQAQESTAKTQQTRSGRISKKPRYLDDYIL